MRAAIYARKSTDDSDRHEDHKSVARQIVHAKDYAKRHGWEVADDHIFVDDGISGAEYQNRPGFARLLAHVKEFDILVMSEASRLGRDMTRNTALVVDILEGGVRIFYYLTNEEERADTPEQKVIITLRGFASEVERLKAGQRSRDALLMKAKMGYVAGGAVYGYSNVPIERTLPDGTCARSHVEYRVNETEAAVIRRIFRAYADGHGTRKIALAMNGDARHAGVAQRYFDGARPPAPRKGTGSWAPSSVRKILTNERYTGKIPFGRHRKAYRKGTKTRLKQNGDVYVAERADLRIVSEPLWNEVVARFASARKTYLRDTNGNLWGRPGMGVEAKYLLTGLARCSCCGANMKATSRRSGSPPKRHIIRYYECSFWANRGTTVCANNRRVHMAVADRTVLDAIEHTVLTPQAIDYVVERAVRVIAERRAERPDALATLQADIRRDERRIENLVKAIGRGDAPQTLVAEIRRLEDAVAAKRGQVERYSAEVPSDMDLKRLKRAAYERLGRFKDLVYGDVPLARQALRKLLGAPIECFPDGRMRGETKVGPLFGQIDLAVATPRGFEPRLPP